MNPLVSVVMGVYNPNKDYLFESLRSLMNQTFQDFEIIIVDDGSTEDFSDIIGLFESKKIRLIKNEENKKLAYCLNLGISVSKGKYIARMDDDDIALPSRLEKQVAVMESNPNINVLATECYFISKDKYRYIPGDVFFKRSMEEQGIVLFFGNAGICHPTVMFRKSFLLENNLRYNEEYSYSQDYGLWVQCVKYTKLYLLDEPLLYYRTDNNNKVSISRKAAQCKCYENIINNQYEELGTDITEIDMQSHIILRDRHIHEIDEISKLYKWVKKVIYLNNVTGVFNKELFADEISNRFEEILISKVSEVGFVKRLLYIIKYFKCFLYRFFKKHGLLWK